VRNRRGYTLIELLVALAAGGVVATAIARVLVHTQRVAQDLAQRMELSQTLRSTLAILPVDLRGLDTSDPAGSDLIQLSDSSLTYKAMRGFYLTCLAASGGRVSLDTAMLGSRPLDPEFDSLLILSEGLLPGRDRWVHLDLRSVTPGRNCPGGRPSWDAGVSPAVLNPDSVPPGSPIRSFEVTEVRRYVDGAGMTWVGARRYSKVTRWNAIQPVAGPLVPSGLRFTYLARDGTPTGDPGRVTRIALMIAARSPVAVWLRGKAPRYLVDSLATQVALRNGR
jgi:prepilin-type N-terminal cleavage/methylation domain-containing protein